MPDRITLVIHFAESRPWVYSCQKCCSGSDEENLCRDGMRISADGCWKKTCHPNQNIFPLGKAELPSCSQFCWTSHPCPSIGDAQSRGVAGIEVLPEHHKPLKEHHLLVEEIWCCLWSKPAGTQGFPRGTRASVCVREWASSCTQCREHELKSDCKKRIIYLKKPRSLYQLTESLLKTSGCFNDPSVLF